jgi:AraC family transcriptional regulator, transcriptional activator FtrA
MSARGHRIAVPVPADTPLFELAVPCEVFGIDRSYLVDPWYAFTLCPVGPPPVALPLGLALTGGGSLEDLAAADTVVVPAWSDALIEPPADLLEALRTAHDRGARIASICTGAFVLAAAGLLDGRPATTHWQHTDALAARYPRVLVDANVLYTDDGDVLTSAGTAAGLDLCVQMVRADYGARSCRRTGTAGRPSTSARRCRPRAPRPTRSAGSWPGRSSTWTGR